MVKDWLSFNLALDPLRSVGYFSIILISVLPCDVKSRTKRELRRIYMSSVFLRRRESACVSRSRDNRRGNKNEMGRKAACFSMIISLSLSPFRSPLPLLAARCLFYAL